MIRTVVLSLVLAGSACERADPRSPSAPRAAFTYPLSQVVFEPLNERTRRVTGAVRFNSGFRRPGQVRTGNGHIYHTVPVRLGGVREGPRRGGGWVSLLRLSPDAQLELRQVRGDLTLESGDALVGFCGRDSPKWLLVALNSPATDPRLLLLPFKGARAPGPTTRTGGCGVYEYRPVT